ncbi:hypothetical protein CL629_02040 [bacterium]|nr:hypothetical protein [bacterium]|tara:strand:+ start:2606 stop:2983 length:378 start_codon:yes stop_codon:yes gene_type:complete
MNFAGSETRKGRYHGSNFRDIEGFGKDRWVIAAYIDFDSDDQLGQSPPWMSEEEVVDDCIKFLNEVPRRKKYEKKELEPLYGNLSLYRYTFRRNESARRNYIEVLLITDQKKNPNFWGKGQSDKC